MISPTGAPGRKTVAVIGDFYLLSLSGAIWSTPTEKILDCPAQAVKLWWKGARFRPHPKPSVDEVSR